MLALYFTLIDDEENRSKFEIVYYTYRKRMLSMAYSVLQNKEDSEDCVQETFIRIARNIKAIDDPYSAETLAYVMKAAKNNAINMLKKNNRRSIYFAAQNTGRVSDDAFFEKINIKNDYERVVKAICEM